MESFGAVLQRFRARAGVSQLALSKTCGVHASIINRFERDERQPADRDTIDRLAAALHLPPLDHDQMLAAGGFFPRAIERLGAADPDLLLVAATLSDERLSARDRDELRTVLRLVTRRWQPIDRPSAATPTSEP